MRKFEICEGYEKKAKLPRRSTKHSAGYDFYTTNDDVIWIEPHKTILIETGIKASMENDEVLLIYMRSSIGIKRGIVLANNVAVIDADYNKNIILALRNDTEDDAFIDPHEKIAQGIFTKYLITDDDNASEERIGGIGSTGR